MIYPILANHTQVRMASETTCRAFRVAVLWLLRSAGAVALAAGRVRHVERCVQAIFPLPPPRRPGGNTQGLLAPALRVYT